MLTISWRLSASLSWTVSAVSVELDKREKKNIYPRRIYLSNIDTGAAMYAEMQRSTG